MVYHYTDHESNKIVSLAYYASARVIADWLVGNTPAWIRVYPRDEFSYPGVPPIWEFDVKLGTTFSPIDPEGQCEEYIECLLPSALNQVFVALSGTAVQQVFFGPDGVQSEAYNYSTSDFSLSTQLVRPFVQTERQAMRVAHSLLLETQLYFEDETVWECVEAVGNAVLAEKELSWASGTLSKIIKKHVGDVHKGSANSILYWPASETLVSAYVAETPCYEGRLHSAP